MMSHTKPWVTNTLEFLLQQIWVKTVHLIKFWNWKEMTYCPYQISIRKDHWILIWDFILNIIEKPGHGHMILKKCHIH